MLHAQAVALFRARMSHQLWVAAAAAAAKEAAGPRGLPAGSPNFGGAAANARCAANARGAKGGPADAYALRAKALLPDTHFRGAAAWPLLAGVARGARPGLAHGGAAAGGCLPAGGL